MKITPIPAPPPPPLATDSQDDVRQDHGEAGVRNADTSEISRITPLEASTIAGKPVTQPSDSAKLSTDFRQAETPLDPDSENAATSARDNWKWATVAICVIVVSPLVTDVIWTILSDGGRIRSLSDAWFAQLVASSWVLAVALATWFAPTSTRARRWSLLWLGGIPLSALISTAIEPFGYWWWERDLVTGVIAPMALAGWWITLRRRGAGAYSMVLVAGLARFGIEYVPLGSVIGAVVRPFLSVWPLPFFSVVYRATYIALPAAIACLIAELPVFSRERTASRRKQRLDRLSPAVADTPGSAMTNGFAVASLVCGLVGSALLAIIFGHAALSQIARFRQPGSGMAAAGLILGYTVLVGVVIFVLVTRDQYGY